MGIRKVMTLSVEVVVALLAAVDAFAQTPKLAPPTDINPQLTEQFCLIEKQFCDAILQKDAKILDSLVVPDHTLRAGDIPQSSLPRAVWMENKSKGESCSQDHLAARKLMDNLAVMSLIVTQKASFAGRDRSGDFYVVDIGRRTETPGRSSTAIPLR